MLPPKPRKSVEVGVRRNHCAAVLHRNGCVLSVRDQLSRCSCLAAQPLENGQVIGTRTDDARCRPLYKRRHEGKSRLKGRGRIEDPRIRGNADEAGQGEDRESEWLGSRCQSGKPTRVLGMFGNDVLEMRVDQDIDIGEQDGCYLAQSNRASSSSASRDLGLSRSTPGRTRAPGVVIKVNAGVSGATCRFRASSKTLEMNALTLSF